MLKRSNTARYSLLGLIVFVSALVGCSGSEVHETTLANGLRVIVREDHRSPVVVSQVWYKVGSMDEPEGLTGVSHVLEHMMFKGTKRLKPNEFSRIIAENGGRENARSANSWRARRVEISSISVRVVSIPTSADNNSVSRSSSRSVSSVRWPRSRSPNPRPSECCATPSFSRRRPNTPAGRGMSFELESGGIIRVC